MIKHLLFLVSTVLAVQIPLFSQMVCWEESFEETPEGWTLQENWTFIPGSLYMYYYPVVANYDFSALSPEILLPSNTGELVVSQFLSMYEPNVTTEKSQISVISGQDETVLWLYENKEGSWGAPEGSELRLPLYEYAGQTIQIRFRSWGPTTDSWWDWSIFNVEITALYDNDLLASAVYGPTRIKVNETATWEIKVTNTGLNPQSEYDVRLFSYRSGELLGSVYVNTTLNPGQSGLYEIPWTATVVQNTCLYGVVVTQNDDYLVNNSTPSHFLRIEPDENFSILFWDNDNGLETVENPESGSLEESQEGLLKALNYAGIQYDYTHSLPADLLSYDAVISTLGCYCYS